MANRNTSRQFAAAGALLAFLAVAAGAFGAHALRSRLSPRSLQIFETAVRYHMYHALALLPAAWALNRWPGPLLRFCCWSFLAGIILFSGSLYLLALADQDWIGAVTPVGGLAFLLGWLSLAWGFQRGGSH